MPRYFFHIVQGGEVVPDEEGSEFPDLKAAMNEARASAKDVARQGLDRNVPSTVSCIEIRDESGRVLGALTIQEVLEHPQSPRFNAACHRPIPPTRLN